MNLFNAAVEDYNQAINLFNTFISYRNNNFLPEKPEAEILKMLTPINGLLDAAQKKLSAIGRIAENFQYDTEELNNKIQNLARRQEEQKKFLKKYFNSKISNSTAVSDPDL